MELMTKELRNLFKKYPVGSQVGKTDPVVIAKYFDPTGAASWWVTEFDGKDHLFGYATLGFGPECDEWGYMSLNELQTTKGRVGLGMERDLHCGTPKPISEFPGCSYNSKR